MSLAQRRNWLSLAVLAALAACVSACAKDEAKPLPAAAKAPAIAAILDALMPHYEAVQVALVKDNGQRAISAANALEAAATKAKESAPEPAARHLAFIAMQAKFIAGGDAANLAPIRSAFGEISRAAVMLVERAPQDVTSKYYLFECPMVQGFNRWIQTDEALANPYMGMEMPACGSKLGMMRSRSHGTSMGQGNGMGMGQGNGMGGGQGHGRGMGKGSQAPGP